jgi:hypothetical protein
MFRCPRNRVNFNFRALGAKFIVDQDNRPWAFRSEFDARQRFGTKEYQYSKISALWFVLRSPKLIQAEPAIRYLSEFFNIDQSPTSTKRPIQVVEESQESKDVKAWLERERELQRRRILEQVLAEIDNRSKGDVAPNGCAVYVMSSELGVKVGISDEPEKRLGQVQTGHPAKVSLFRVLWFFSRDEAAVVETKAQLVLTVRGAHLSGEWFKLSAAAASSSVSKVVQELIQCGRIESQFADVRRNGNVSDIEMKIAKFTEKKWFVSKRGNEWINLEGAHITVFPRRKRWSYIYNGSYASALYATMKAAKIAALQAHFQPHPT